MKVSELIEEGLESTFVFLVAKGGEILLQDRSDDYDELEALWY